MRTFDGIICFGGSDWWYHNRGHYDLQMCRHFRRRMPVLYVNSLGVRVPSLREGGMFLRRVARKARSWRRGFVRVDDNFGVVSPLSIPGPVGRRLTEHVVLAQVRAAARRMGISRPLVWVECPTAEPYLRAIPHAAAVYQRTDRYEEFPGVDRDAVRAMDRALKAHADLTLFCSTLLHESEADACNAARFVDHGVDAERFTHAGEHPRTPDDTAGIDRPRAGFVGGIDPHTFDPDLFLEVASRCPDVRFVMVGACSLPEGWCRLPNVHLLGRRPYERVADYMAACDVLIMPWRRSPWIEACNPVKLKEYLAVGRPVVSTPFHELHRFDGLVEVASSAPDFAKAIRGAIDDPGCPDARRRAVREHTWDAKAEAVLAALAERGVAPQRETTPGATVRAQPATAPPAA